MSHQLKTLCRDGDSIAPSAAWRDWHNRSNTHRNNKPNPNMRASVIDARINDVLFWELIKKGGHHGLLCTIFTNIPRIWSICWM